MNNDTSSFPAVALLATIAVLGYTLVVNPGALAFTNHATITGPYADTFTTAGNKHGIDPSLLSAVAKAESGYNPDAASPAGARGIMQLMPGTAAELDVNPRSVSSSVDGAARLLAKHKKQFRGNTSLMLAAYNAGPGAVTRYGGVPPFPETQAYVVKVKKFQREIETASKGKE